MTVGGGFKKTVFLYSVSTEGGQVKSEINY